MHGYPCAGEATRRPGQGPQARQPAWPRDDRPETRDVVQTAYVRRVQKRGGRIQNVEFEQIPNLKDPGK